MIDGQPLYASRGAEIEGKLTHVESFSLKSVALGGDSPIIYNHETGKVDIAASRLGPAACFNGNAATVTMLLISFMNWAWEILSDQIISLAKLLP